MNADILGPVVSTWGTANVGRCKSMTTGERRSTAADNSVTVSYCLLLTRQDSTPPGPHTLLRAVYAPNFFTQNICIATYELMVQHDMLGNRVRGDNTNTAVRASEIYHSECKPSDTQQLLTCIPPVH